MKYAVIDISSSGLSFIVAETLAKNTEIVFKDRMSLSLLHYMDGKKLAPRGIEKLIDALILTKDACAELGVSVVYVISTAALRAIENFDEVSAAVTEKTGFPVNFIDGPTEAYCDLVANEYYASYDRPVLIDLGGKSIEICDLSKSGKEDMICLDFGVFDLYSKFVEEIQPSAEEAKDIKKYVKARFDKQELPGEGTFATAVVVGATAQAVYEIYADFADAYEADGVKTIRYKKFKKFVKHLIEGEDRSGLIMNNAPEKLHVAVPAAIVLKTLFKRFGVGHIVVSDRGVKEGYLRLVLDGKEQGEGYDFRAAKQPPAAKDGKQKKAKAEGKGGKSSAEGKQKKTGSAEGKGNKSSAEGKAANGVKKAKAGAKTQKKTSSAKKSDAKTAPAAEDKANAAQGAEETAAKAADAAPAESAACEKE